MSAISIKNLQKIYKTADGKGKLALDHIDLDVPRGSFFGLLGPNGAGKSTLINIMAGLVVKTVGRLSICGYDIDTDTRAARYAIGIVPQELVLDPFFTPRQVLENTAGYYGVRKKKRRTDEIIEAVGLAEKANAPARSLSGGMRRRLLVAKALVHSPDVLVLDEPTAGVDVQLREQLWEYVLKLNKEGTTILLTTHYLEEAEELCDRIAVINHGKVIANDEKRNLMQTIDQKCIVVTPSDPINTIPEQLNIWQALLNEHGQLEVTYQSNKDSVADILAAICDAKIVIKDISIKEADLEDVFKHLTSDHSS